jgi:hypothetical protein
MLGAERIEAFADRAGAKSLDEIGRRAQHELSQHVGDGLELARKRLDRFGIVRAELRHRLQRAAFAGQQIAAVGRGQEILDAALDDREAVLAQFQVRDDLRVQQTDGVGRDRIAKAGMKLFRHRGAAHHLAAFDHLHAQARHREIGRAGEAVMPGADDDDVCLVHLRFKNC